MALSDCEKCWDTPCTCGYSYKNNPSYSQPEQMAKFMSDILGYRTKEELEIILSILNRELPKKISSIDNETEIQRTK